MEINTTVSLVIGAIIAVCVIAYMVFNQQDKVLEWLKGAVTEAEKKLGSGTGQLKLRTVYDWFIAKFPILSAIIPFRVFSAWVDEALEEFEEWLDNNIKIEKYVKNKE